ncbi:hypothetical protein BTO05_00485 [Winogradskyella sp. PC-19]|uniref:hypothetical protein n=1 Tax=Winogradskyella sp. PC-19 TaxID=754417 RepID=UPI000B5526CE|nr:hypothetical protein [Winogradskyella sp. PC-19]ARV10671.1 hypothetical protein BTO05_00485 [Winogradskyella sp. PC-19]
MKKYIFSTTTLILFISFSFSQSLKDLDNYTVDEFYKKVELDYGTLDEDGDDIDYIYVKTEVDSGDYKIELSDGDGDLYEVKGTNIYIKFRGYFGYAGYSTECIMKVDYYSATVYKLE